MAIQHREERLTRADNYMKEASYVRGMARALLDVVSHMETYQAGNDPAREIKKLVIADLRMKNLKALREVERLETAAQAIRNHLEKANQSEKPSIDIANEVVKTQSYSPTKQMLADTRMITGLENLSETLKTNNDQIISINPEQPLKGYDELK